MNVRRLRYLATPVVIVLACAAIAAVPATRTAVLRAAGWLLVVDDAVVEPVEIVVVTVDAGGAGVLEAADLVQRGMAARVAVFADPPDEVDKEFVRRGVPYEDAAARSIRQLQSLGITAVEEIPRAATGTDDEVEILGTWSEQRRLQSVIVVSTSDHSRRLRRVLDRAMKGHATKTTVRYSRYSQFDPEGWWQTRAGTRTAIVELQKLLLDFVRHPFS